MPLLIVLPDNRFLFPPLVDMLAKKGSRDINSPKSVNAEAV